VIRTSVEALLLAGWSEFSIDKCELGKRSQFDVADDEKCDVHCNLACVQFLSACSQSQMLESCNFYGIFTLCNVIFTENASYVIGDELDCRRLGPLGHS
jgi:hypothetical protein